MSNTKRDPLLSDDGINKLVPEEADFYDCELTAIRVREVYESARAKDAELIQHLVDAIAYSRKHGPPVSLSDSHWDISLHNALSYAAAAGFKPLESTN